VTVSGRLVFDDIGQPHADIVAGHARNALESGKSGIIVVSVSGKKITVLVSVLQPPPRILVLGAGLDAQPVVRFVNELGWRATVQDHRPAYIENGDFSTAESVICVPAAELGEATELNRYDAAIVMSHHLTTDRTYLKLLAGSAIASIGLLGPYDRRCRLLEEIGDDAVGLEGRLQGPAGIDIGARGPAAIALSIVAQMHMDLMA
jgi:xanthine/CO dehydrogenase XdhC/CoxF family maturation factor